MSMHDGMDLSRFRKVSSDGKTSTLKHLKGHEVKIAHNGLTPKMRAHLEGMPLHLAEGTPNAAVGEDDSQLLTDIPELGSTDAADAQQLAQSQPQNAAPTQPLSIDISPSSYTPTAQPMQAQAIMPVKNPQDDMAEHVRYATDIANGQIHPKTYSELFAKNEDGSDRGTLGRIGTLFGLMVSGAGSGLTHQPNMLMEMMNKEIDRDFEKQKINKEGARNFLSVQYAHDLQEAQAAEHNIRTQNEAMKGMGEAVGTANFLKDSGYEGTANILPEYIKKAHLIMTEPRAKAKAVVTAADYLDKKTMNNPQANAVVKNVVIPQATAFAGKLIEDGHAKAGEVLKQGQRAMAQSAMPVNEDRLSQAIQAGKNARQRGFVPGKDMIDPNDIPVLDKEKSELNNIRSLVPVLDAGFHEIAGMRFAGQAPGLKSLATAIPTIAGAVGSGGLLAGVAGAAGHVLGKSGEDFFQRKRNLIKDNLKQRLANSNMTSEEKEDFVNSVLPSYQDDEKDYPKVYEQAMRHLHDLELNKTATTQRYAAQIPGLVSPFPRMRFRPKKEDKKK